MVVTKDVWIPSEEELTQKEIKLTSGPLTAAGHQLGKFCDNQCKEFMLCWYETHDPRACLSEGKQVTECGLDFFGKVKKHCALEFTDYFTCVDKWSGCQLDLNKCRKYQSVFDTCIQEKFGQIRPEHGHFNRVRLHNTNRAKPVLTKAPMPEKIPDLPDFENMPDPALLNVRKRMTEYVLK